MKKILFIIVVLIVIVAGICTGIYLKLNVNPINYIKARLHVGIENTILTSENFEEITSKYSEKVGEYSDENYYLSYIVLKQAFSNLTESDPYSALYGKTINELIDEAKHDMETNDITLEEYKESLESLSSEN